METTTRYVCGDCGAEYMGGEVAPERCEACGALSTMEEQWEEPEGEEATRGGADDGD